MKTTILGAGLTGLSTAYHLEKDYALFEKESGPGGLCRSRQADGFTFDKAGHLLHFKDERNCFFIKKLLKGNLKAHARNSGVWSRGNFIPYPFQCHLYSLPQPWRQECLQGFRRAWKKNRKEKSFSHFEKWICSRFGSGIARHFMLPYNKKFWCYPLKKIESSWANNWIPVPSLKDVEKGANGFSGKNFGYNSVFWYPERGGIQALVNALTQGVSGLRTGHEAISLDLKKQEVVFKNGCSCRYDNLVSTIPLSQLIRLMTSVPSEVKKASLALKFISIYNVNLGLKNPWDPKKHWIYFPNHEPSFYRMGIASNFSNHMAPPGAATFYFEFSYLPGSSARKLLSLQDIRRACSLFGFNFKSKDILSVDVNDIKFGYCLYTKEREKALAIIQRFFKKNNIFSIGRYGAWRYSSMEDALEEGRRMAQMIKGS